MTAKARSGIKRHKAKGLGGRGVDDFPDIDVHAGCQKLELVYQSYIHAAENILEQLGHFGGTSGADRNHFCDDLCV